MKFDKQILLEYTQNILTMAKTKGNYTYYQMILARGVNIYPIKVIKIQLKY